MNYDNFFFGVDNMTEARNYYETTLDLKLKFDFSDKGMLAFNVGAEEPAIILKDKNIFANIKPTIWLEVKNVAEEYEKLEKRGVKFLSKPFRIKTGMAVEFEDPFGNRLGITDYDDRR